MKIYAAYSKSKSTILRNILIFSILIYFSTSLFSQDLNSSIRHDNSGSLWVGAYAGPSQLVEKAPDSIIPEIQDYFNKLRTGWHYGFETEYFFNKYVGVGAKYIHFNTKQEVDSIVVEFFSKILYIDLSSDMSINTFSPLVFGNLPLLDNKLSVTLGAGPAWLFYRNLGKAVGDSAMFKGSSPGFLSSLRVSYEVFPNLNFAFQTNYIHAFLKEFTQDNGTTEELITLKEEDYQNISRFDFSFGLFYTFRRK